MTVRKPATKKSTVAAEKPKPRTDPELDDLTARLAALPPKNQRAVRELLRAVVARLEESTTKEKKK